MWLVGVVNVRLKIVASGCDRYVLASRCGRWVWSLDGALNDQCDQWLLCV